MLHESGMDCIQVWHITSNVGCMLTQPTESWIEAYLQPPCRASQPILHVFSKKIAAKETAAWGISVVSAPQGLRHVYSQRYLPIWAPASPNNIFCQKVFIGDRPKVWTAFYKWNAALTPSKMGTLGPLHWHFRPIAFSSFPPRWLSPGPWQVGIRRPAAGLYEYNKPIYIYIVKKYIYMYRYWGTPNGNEYMTCYVYWWNHMETRSTWGKTKDSQHMSPHWPIHSWCRPCWACHSLIWSLDASTLWWLMY